MRVYLARASELCRMSLGVSVHVSCSLARWAELSGKPERSIDTPYQVNGNDLGVFVASMAVTVNRYATRERDWVADT